MDILNISGLVITTIGTVVTIWQAIKAKKYSVTAKNYRDEILSDRIRFALIDLLSIGKQTREECKKITTPVDKRHTRGVNSQKVINEIQDFSDRLKENCFKINNNDITKLAESLEKKIEEYKRNSAEDIRFYIADDIYKIMNESIILLSELLHKKM